MNIGYVFDDGFVLPAGVSIFSLLENNRHIDDIKIYILDDGISSGNKLKLDTMVKEFDREVVFISVDQVKEKLSKITKYNWNGSYSTYIRLMLNSLFPDCNDKIMMIDADTIVVGKIDELNDYDLEGKPCAMALEAMPISYYIHSGLGMNKLINGGLIIVDLKKWREADAEEKIINFLTNVREKNMLTDEDVLSTLFKDDFSVIRPRNNCLVQYSFYAKQFYYKFFGWDKLHDNNAFYSLEELVDARENPVILHCIDSHTNRPWHKNNNHPYTKAFDEYLAKTPWKNIDKKIKPMGLVSKIEYFLRGVLPKVLSDFYYAVVLRIYYGVGAKRYYKYSTKI